MPHDPIEKLRPSDLIGEIERTKQKQPAMIGKFCARASVHQGSTTLVQHSAITRRAAESRWG